MRRLILAIFGVVAFGAAIPAKAADIPRPMPVKGAPTYVHAFYNWTGFYLGAHVG
jgi:outer membrane immunogenic protein